MNESMTTPLSIGKALNETFRLLSDAHNQGYCSGGEEDSPENQFYVDDLAAYWTEGTVNSLATQPELSMSLLIRLLLDYTSSSSRSALLISHTPSEEIITKMTAYYSRIDYTRLKEKRIGSLDLPYLSNAAFYLEGRNCFFHCGQFSPGLLKSLIANHSETCEPFGLVLVNGLPVSQSSEQSDYNFIELRDIAVEHNLSVIVSTPISQCDQGQGSNDAENIGGKFDLSLTLRPSNEFRYELAVFPQNGPSRTIRNLMLHSEIGVMEE
jgi:hypothetical protein